MKVLVIGGAGYIGSHAVYELIRDNHEVVIVDNLSTGQEKNINEKAKFYLGDITKKEDLVSIFEEECAKKPFDLVMHFAAKLLVTESVTKPLEYYHNNVEGVRLMLEVMTEFNIKNVIFSSTAATYGMPKNGICTEEDEVKPINPYGNSKLACEYLIKDVCNAYDMNYGIFRYFNVAGADDSLEIGYNYDREVITHLIPIVAEVVLKKRDGLKICGDDYDTKDGTCIRDYIHVTDLAKAHVLGAKHLLNENKSFTVNLGSNEGYTVKEVADIANSITSINVQVTERREGDPAILIASNKKAREILSWEPTKNLEEIIKSEIEYRKTC